MRKVLIIALREFLDTVRTKAFFLSVVIVPGLIILLTFGAERIAKMTEREAQPLRTIGVLDESGAVFERLEPYIAEYNTENPQRPLALEPLAADHTPEELAQRVRDGALYAYLRIPAATVEGDPNVPAELARKDQQLAAGRDLQRMLNRAVQDARFQRAGLPQERVRELRREVAVVSVDVRTGTAGQDDEFVRLLTPFAFMFLLFMGTLQISYGLLTSLLEEKSSRVIEVLLSAVSPVQLMAGKILGSVLVGLTLLGLWGGVGYYAAVARGFGHIVSPQILTLLGLYFLPGFLLLAAALGAIGSACNTLKEAQSMASPITLVTVLPMMLWLPLSQSPDSLFAVVLSFVPPITPFVMVLRVCANPDTALWQIVATQVLLWAAVIATIWAAAKVFRIGVLMYGKPPSLRELLRWVRYA